jgi:hypothetical protein
MTDTLHANDVGTEIYIDVTENSVSIGAALSSFTTRTVKLRRATTDDVVVITTVTIAVDPDDGVSKLKLVTGTNTGLALTGTGAFKIPVASLGIWIAEVILGDAGWTGTTNAFELFEARQNLA